MGAIVSIEDVLADRRVFRGGQPLARGQGATPSGFAALDEALPWGGFPRGALTEILVPAPGLGELELLSQAWTRIGEQERLAFVAPPCIPYAPALLRAKWPLARFAWIEAPQAQAAWAAEQCLRAGCLGAVAFWLDRGDDRSLRRLQLAAEEGSVHAFLFRPVKHAANASPAALRLLLEPSPGVLKVRVLKVRGAVAPARSLQRERIDTLAANDVRDVRGVRDAHDAPDVDVRDVHGAHDACNERKLRDLSKPRDRRALRNAIGHAAHVARNNISLPAQASPAIGTRQSSSIVARESAAIVVHAPCSADATSAPVQRVIHDAGSARTARAFRTLRALLASRNLRAVAARRAPVV